MRKDQAEILDKCIGRVMRGETIEASLAEYPDMRDQLEPLLHTALSISSTPKVSPSSQFAKTSKTRLLNLIREDSIQTAKASKRKSQPESGWLVESINRLWRGFTSGRRVAIPVTIVLVIALIAGLGQFLVTEPTTAVASTSTLSILSGSVTIQKPDSNVEEEGLDGMPLSVGTQIKTGPDSHALLTFLEGSTIKLEPDTHLEIQEVDYGDGQSSTIILKQWLGKTWSRVVKMVDPGSRYEIETPSATAIVRGTLFTTKVEETGTTTVLTTEGLVSVAAEEQEVFVPANQQTEVTRGTEPSQPLTSTGPKSKIIIILDGPSASSVTDPTGASTGRMPDGLNYNQIPGSQSIVDEGEQSLLIPDPVTGEYTIVLRYDTPGATRFTIQYLLDGEVISEDTGKLLPLRNKEWLLNIDIEVEDGVIVSAEVGDFEPLGENKPENVVDPDSDDKPGKAGERGQDRDKEKGRDENKDKNNDDRENEDRGERKDKNGDRNRDEADENDKPSPRDKSGNEKDGGENNNPSRRDKSGNEKDGGENDNPSRRDKSGNEKDDDKKDSPSRRDKSDDENDNDKKDNPSGRDKKSNDKDDDKKDNPSGRDRFNNKKDNSPGGDKGTGGNTDNLTKPGNRKK